MTLLSNALSGKNVSQKDIEYFDYCMDGDVEAFFDYTLVKYHAQRGDKLAREILQCVNSYMKELYVAIFNDDEGRILQLLSGLGEVKYTKIGFAKSKNGNGIGSVLREALKDKLLFIRYALDRGNYSYLTLPISLDGIDVDRASDILTAISLSVLIKFTEEMAIKYNWPTKETVVKKYYDRTTGNYISYKAKLPIANGDTVIIYPKKFINSSSNINAIFYKLKWSLFYEYIRYDLRFAEYWKGDKNYITKRQFEEILSSDKRNLKDYLRELILNTYGVIDKLENNLEDIRIPTDEDLESLQHCRIRNTA